ncbi:hypothetical protein [Pandoraea norimbergensis]|uniref:Uncharacterized protein n=1 Tax=Pandoraea norimbergensis TaxID=93219 RepID=A0ABN4JIT1_9BURK|nr:hypothetical protein [Pandoraea norimbergensis]ALS60796.1 hypothetical protein AT302_14505 [Pandoraea norimbergensis]
MACPSQRNSLTILGQPADLPAPRVVEANGDELDPDDAVTGANVVIDVWPEMAAQDGVMLRWEGVKASGAPWVHIDEQIIAAPAVGQPVNFLVPPEYVSALAGGTVTVYYIITPATPGALPRESARVMLTVLGEVTLPAPDVDGVSNGELNPPDDPAAGVNVTVPAWELMSVGDVLEAFWEGQTAAGTVSAEHTLTASDLNQPYVFLVPREFVDANAAGQDFVDVWYRVTRTGQPAPQNSAVNRFRVITPLAPALPPPEVDEAVGDILDPEPLPAAGATVRVKPYDGMVAGDAITIRFGAGSGGGEHTDTLDVTANMVGQDITLRVPKSKVQFHAGSTVVVNYTVYRLDGREQDSEDRVLTVRTDDKWPAPGVDDAEDDYLDPELAALGATTRIFSYAGMQRDDRVVLHWGNPGDAGYYTDSITLSTEVAVSGPLADVDAPECEQAVNGALNPDDLGAPGASFVIKAYAGMAVGDYILLRFDAGGPNEATADFDVTTNFVGQDVTIRIPKNKIVPALDTAVDVDYVIEPAAGGDSIASEILSLYIGVRDDVGLTAPSVDEADGDHLDPEYIEYGVRVRIPVYDDMAIDDEIVLHWGAEGDAGYYTDRITVRAVREVTFPILTENLEPFLNKTVPVPTASGMCGHGCRSECARLTTPSRSIRPT